MLFILHSTFNNLNFEENDGLFGLGMFFFCPAKLIFKLATFGGNKNLSKIFYCLERY